VERRDGHIELKSILAYRHLAVKFTCKTLSYFSSLIALHTSSSTGGGAMSVADDADDGVKDVKKKKKKMGKKERMIHHSWLGKNH